MNSGTTLSTSSLLTQIWPSGLEPPTDEELWAALARNDYSFYCEYVHRGRYYHARHTEYICKILEQVEKGKIKRLMLFLPPRHSKSMTVTETFPSFFIGRNPERRVIVVSYGDALARRFGRFNRRKIEEFGRQIFGIEVADDNASMTNWSIKGHRGGMVSAGIGGPITGEGADLLIIDDPIKNRQEAESITYREMVWSEWQNTLLTRLHPGGAIIIILTRWHEDDLAGRLLRTEPEKWMVISLPAIAEEDDLLGRQPGEPLWPEHGFDKAWAEATKASVGPYVWAALYQQRPQPAEGGIFKRTYFRYFRPEAEWYTLHRSEGDKRVPKNDCWIFQTCDPAGSTKTTADYFAMATWALTPDRELLLLDMIRERLEGPDQINLFRQAYLRFKPAVQAVESRGLGLTLYQMLLREGLPVVELKAETDKVTRALPAAARMQAGTVYFPEGAAWLGDYEAELLAFPNGEHDDQVDVTSYAAQFIAWDIPTAATGRAYVIG